MTKDAGYARVNGLAMYYEIHGAGEPLVVPAILQDQVHQAIDQGHVGARLVPQMERMEALGLTPAASAFAVKAETDYIPPAKTARIALSSQSGLPRIGTGSTPPTSTPRTAFSSTSSACRRQ